MKLFHLTRLVDTRLNLFLDDSCFFREPAGIVCHAFEAFSRGCILLEFSSYN